MEVVENNEVWKVIDEYEKYEVSSLGRVRKTFTGSFISPIFSREHYYVNLYKGDGKPHATLIHKIVARAFCENPNNYDIVYHIDKNKINNISNNLQCCTIRECFKYTIKKKQHKWNSRYS